MVDDEGALPELTYSSASASTGSDPWSSPSSSSSSETGVADSVKPAFELSWLITKGAGGVVYGGRDPCGDRIVLKVALPDLEPALQDEYEVGRHLRDFESDAEAPRLLL